MSFESDAIGPPRLANVDDAPQIAHLLHDFNCEFDTPSPGVDFLTERLKVLLASPTTLAIIVGNPAVAVGLVTLRSNVWYVGPVALLDELYVQPELRNRGIGSTIIEYLLAEATARHIELIEINVDIGDVDARRFYERHDFSAIDPTTNEYALYYQRELAQIPT